MSGHHSSSYKLLLSVAGALLALTVLTVVVHYMYIPEPYSIIIAVVIAVFKAALVALFFMNLYWDSRFNTMLFITAFVFLTLLVGITLLDVLSRDVPVPSF